MSFIPAMAKLNCHMNLSGHGS